LARVHPHAVVDPGAKLADDVAVGAFSWVGPGVELGPGVAVANHVSVMGPTTIGPRTKLYPFAAVGGDPQDKKYANEPTRLVIGADCQIREGVTIHRGTEAGSATVVGSDCFLMGYSHVAHNCRLGDGVILANGSLLAGHVHVAEKAFVSGTVVVHQFCRIGRLAMVGGNSTIPMDCLPFVTTVGTPARALGLNLVGLRRAGIDGEGRRALKEGYRILLRSGLALEAALEHMTALRHPLVDEMVAFVRGSKRGFHRAERAREAEAE